MKLNKSLVVAAFAATTLFAGGAIASAQISSTNLPPGGLTGSSGGGMRPRTPNIDYLTKQLELTDDQKTNVLAALNEQREKMRDVRADTSLSTEDRRAQMKQLREDFNAKMKQILTPDQYTKWQHMAGRNRPMPAHLGPGVAPTNAPAAAQ